jgi:serine/threonine protein kinase
MLEVAEGVQYIHSQGIVHGDLRGVSVSLPFSSKTEMMRARKISSWILIFAAKLLILA